MNKKIRAFTLMEVISVVLIISIIASFSVVNYSKAILKADERNMIANLMVMRSAVGIYTLDGRTIGAWNSLAAINNNLVLSILDTKATYACRNAAGFTNGCTATHPRGWAVHFHDEHSGGGIHCSAGACPSCPDSATPPGNCG
ncbi:MAG: prepilin-type N-terminal cleavage/methylation domain-containing protein [Candidatus Omnitrophica bacterium]|nr:prepilin-type N-terminal cleavage/methylation domain-containing protein [Candidatus Omnitrophota bacterium]